MNLRYQYHYIGGLLKRYGFLGLILKTLERRQSPMRGYGACCQRFLPTEEELAGQRKSPLPFSPLVSIVVPAYETPEAYLRGLMDAVCAQSYPNWELCIADGSKTGSVERIAAEYAKKDKRIRYRRLLNNGGISENTNAGFEMAKGSYIALMDHDDLIAPNALYEMVRCLNEAYEKEERRLALIYSDEDKINSGGTVHSRPHFKPDFNREFLRRNNYFCHFLLFSKELLQKAGGLRKEYDGAQDYDFVLRCVDAGAVVRHVPKILYHWRIHEGSTAGNSGDKLYAFDNGCRAIEAHLKRCKEPGKAEATENLGVYKVSYELKGSYTLTVAAADKRQLKKIKEYYGRQDYTNKKYRLNIRYIHAEVLTPGIGRDCIGDYILYIREDTRVKPEGLIEGLLRICQHENNAIAAAKLYGPGGHVDSCGLTYDRKGHLISLCGGLYAGYKGYFLHAVIPQNVSAAVLDCAMFRREACMLPADNGMHGIYGDADLCFTLAAEGYDTVVTPEVTAVSRRSRKEDGLSKERFFKRWEQKLSVPDPYYNRNLSLIPGHTYAMRERRKFMRDVFIIGSKGIPAAYGGFETFAEQLTRHKKDLGIRYHVACMADKGGSFEYQKALCFRIRVPDIGPAKAVWYDLASFFYCLKYIKAHRIKAPVVYVLACRIGPFAGFLKHRLKKRGGTLLVNPDGHEWMRAKWSRPVRAYWKFSEKLMVKHADLVVCDSKNMQRYIRDTYRCYTPRTTFIAYGADVEKSSLSDSDETLADWYKRWGLASGEYFLIVGRFVPENNYETMIAEFMRTKTDKKLAVISNVEDNPFYRRLKGQTGFDRDARIVFCGTVYEEQLLKKIRENACAYLHGHEVGGTNPSLLEALGSTRVNLLLDVGFNREVAGASALYWTKDKGSLKTLLEKAALFGEAQREQLGNKARQRILTAYSHEKIAGEYEELFRRI